MERKITSKAEFLETIKKEKEQRKKAVEAQEKKLAEIEKKIIMIKEGY